METSLEVNGAGMPVGAASDRPQGLDYGAAMDEVRAPKEYGADGLTVTGETRDRELRRGLASARVLMETDVDLMSPQAQSGFLSSVTQGMYGFPDPDGVKCFGSRAGKTPRENIEKLRAVLRGEDSFDSEEDRAFDAASDDEKFEIARKAEGAGQKFRMFMGNSRPGGFLDWIDAFILEDDAHKEEAMRDYDYATMSPEDKAEYRKATVAEYMRKRASRSVVSNVYRMTAGMSDLGKDLVVNAVRSGRIDGGAFASLPREEQDGVVSAVSALRGELKEGRLLGFSFNTRDDDGDTNTLRLGLYDFQQSIIGLAADVGRLSKGVAQYAYGKVLLDGDAREQYFDRIRREEMIRQAFDQAAPEEDNPFAVGFRGVASSLILGGPGIATAKGTAKMAKAVGAGGKWFLKTRSAAKAVPAAVKAGGKIAAAEGRLGKAKTALSAAEIDLNAAKMFGPVADTSAEAVAYARMSSSVQRYEAAIRKSRAAYASAKGEFWKGAGLAAAGDLTMFSNFAMEYVGACDAAGISREDSIPVSIAVGKINGMLENIYVPGLEHSLVSSEVKSMTLFAMAEAIRTEGRRGLGKWTANYLRHGVPELLRVTAEEGFVEEGLQQICTEHGKRVAGIVGEMRKLAGDDPDKMRTVGYVKVACDTLLDNLAEDWKTYCDTVAEVLPSSVGFGVLSPFSQMTRQGIRNRSRRAENRASFEARVAEYKARNERTAKMLEGWADIDERSGDADAALARREQAKLVRAQALTAPMMENGGGAASLDYDEGLVDLIQKRDGARRAVTEYWDGKAEGPKPKRGSDAAADEARGRAAAFAQAESKAREILRTAEPGADTAARIADAFGVDVQAGEVVQAWLMEEQAMSLYSHQAKALSSSTALANLTEENIATVLPGYVDGSFKKDAASGTATASFKGADGAEHTIAYVVGDMSLMLKEEIERNVAPNSKFGQSYDARNSGREGFVPWAQLSDAERARIAWTGVNGYSSGVGGKFFLKTADGESFTVDAEDVVYLANGRLADVGYSGSYATMKTARHETWHSLWRFFSKTQPVEDIRKFAEELGIDTNREEAVWRKELDETVAYQVEDYASGHWVHNAVSARMDRIAESPVGRFVVEAGRWLTNDPGRIDPRTGREYDLESFMRAYQRGELSIPAGRVRTERPKKGAEGVAEDTKRAESTNAPVEVTEEEIRAQQAEDAAAAERDEGFSVGVPYQGSKNRIAERVVDFLPAGDRFVDLFSGGGAMTHAAMLSGKYGAYRMNDVDGRGQDLFLGAMRGDYRDYDRTLKPEEWDSVKDGPEAHIWSRMGNGRQFNADAEATARQLRRVQRVEDSVGGRQDEVEATKEDYRSVELKPGDVVYADIPYAGTDTAAYRGTFDRAAFDRWAQEQKVPVFVSSYEMGDGWSEVASFRMRGVKDVVTEKVFVQDRFAADYVDDGSFSSNLEKSGTLEVGMDLEDKSSFISLKNHFERSHEIPSDIRLLPHDVGPREALEYYDRNILGKTFVFPDGNTITMEPGHFFRLTCEGNGGRDGIPKGFVSGYESSAQALEGIRRGEVSIDNIYGWKSDRAGVMPLFPDLVEHPSVILTLKDDTSKSENIKRYNIGEGRSIIAGFRIIGGGRRLLTFHGFGAHYKKAKKYRVTFVDDAVNSGTSPDTHDGGNASRAIPSVSHLLTDDNVKVENYHASKLTDPVDADTGLGNGSFSVSSLAFAAGFEPRFGEDAEGRKVVFEGFFRDGVKRTSVTVDDIMQSPVGAMLRYSQELGDVDEERARQVAGLFAGAMNAVIRTGDLAFGQQLMGSAIFTGIKTNSDKQYGTTFDFPSICTKTQAMIDAMSENMVRLARGLSKQEILALYRHVFDLGAAVPCPECYVFSRWIGIGGLLDNLATYQRAYGGMEAAQAKKVYDDMAETVNRVVQEWNETHDEEHQISFGKGKGKLAAQFQKNLKDLEEKIGLALNKGETPKQADVDKRDFYREQYTTVKAMTWFENVFFRDAAMTRKREGAVVPTEILFDLNRSGEFAEKYPEAWNWRCTQGAGYGKAITPYAEASLGEGVQATGGSINAMIKAKKAKKFANQFLQGDRLTTAAKRTFRKAIQKMRVQAFLGGQRFQSTSDARFENMTDYLIAHFEVQEMRGMVQLYTKVLSAVPFFAKAGDSVNMSMMPDLRTGGVKDVDGKLVPVDTSTGGASPERAQELRKAHPTAGTITIGANDEHIRALVNQAWRDFVIPFHMSGGDASVETEMRAIQEGQAGRVTPVVPSDYTSTQGDKVLSDEVLSAEWGLSSEQIARVHAVRAARLAILTGKGTVDMEVVRSNKFLSRLYDRLNGGEWDGVRVGKGKIESHIFPNEFFDTSVKSLEESAVWTREYLEYCRDLGFLHRFSGTVPRNGRLARVPGRNRKGEKVKLEDLFYKYDAEGNRTEEIEPYMWRLLVDRRMLDNEGRYQPQKEVDLSRVDFGDLESFAKNQQGVRNYDTFVANNDHAKVEDLMAEQGRSNAPTPSALKDGGDGSASFSAAYPSLSRMSSDEVLVAYAASKIAIGRTNRPSDRSVNVSLVKRELKAIHPEWDDARLGTETQRVAHEASALAGRIRSDLDRGVSQSKILAGLPDAMKERYRSEARTQQRAGQRVGEMGEAAEAEMAERKARIVADAVSVQAGVSTRVLENAYGLDLSKTMLGIATNPSIRRDAEGNILPPNDGQRNVSEQGASDADAALEEESSVNAKPVDAAVQAAVDEIVKLSREQRAREKANPDPNAQNRADAAGHDAEVEAGQAASESESGLTGADPVAAAVLRNGVDMEDPRQMALFVVELSRRWWCDNHGLAKGANPWTNPVAVQFLRRTARDVYAKLVAETTYSRGRETATRCIDGFLHVPTVQGLVTEMTLAGSIINRNMIRETQKQLCEKLDLFLREKFGAGGRFKADNEELRRRVPAEFELRARYMRHAMWLTPGAVAEEAAELQRELDAAAVDFQNEGHAVNQSRVFVEITRKLNILREFGGLQYKPVAQIEAAVQWWHDAEQAGAMDIADAFAAREVRTKKAAAVMARAIANAKRAYAANGRSFSELVDRYAQSHMAFTHLLRDLMRYASEADRAEAEKIVRWLELEIQKDGTAATTERRRHADALADAVKRIYGKDFAKVIAELGERDDRFAPFMSKIDGKPVEPTRGRAIQLMVSLLQEGRRVEVQDPSDPNNTIVQWVGGYHDNIVAHKRDGQADLIRKMLSPADLNLVAWLGSWYEQNRQELSDVCQSLFGIGVYAETSNYMPVKMLLEDQGLEKAGALGWSIFPKALTPRVRNEKDFDTRADVLEMFMQRMEEGAQWKAFANLGLELRGIFGRAELQASVVASHGKAAKDNLLSFVTDVLAGSGAGSRSKGGFTAYIDAVRGWAAIGALGGNVGVMLKQPTSVPAFGFEIGLGNTVRHLLTAFSPDGLSAMSAVWNSQERKNRWNVGNSEAVANALASKDTSWFKRAWKASMITNKLGDVVPALVIGQGIYRDALASGMSPADAMAKTWMIVERTQQSSRIENQPQFQRRFKAGNAIYQFLSTQLQYLNYEMRDIRAVAADPASTEKWGRLANTLVINHFLLSSAYYWMGQMWRALLGQEPPEEQLSDWVVSMLMGPWGALYAAGITCTDAMNTWVKGYKFGQGGGISSLQWLSNVAVRDPRRLVRDALDGSKTADDVLEDLGKWCADFNATFRDLRKVWKYRIKGEPQK